MRCAACLGVCGGIVCAHEYEYVTRAARSLPDAGVDSGGVQLQLQAPPRPNAAMSISNQPPTGRGWPSIHPKPRRSTGWLPWPSPAAQSLRRQQQQEQRAAAAGRHESDHRRLLGQLPSTRQRAEARVNGVVAACQNASISIDPHTPASSPRTAKGGRSMWRPPPNPGISDAPPILLANR